LSRGARCHAAGERASSKTAQMDGSQSAGGGALQRATTAVDDKLADLAAAIESIQSVDLADAMAGLSAAESARATVAIGTQAAALVALYLRLSGVDIRDHPIAEELKSLKALASRVPGESGAGVGGPRLDMGAAGRLIAGGMGSRPASGAKGAGT
jgi:hypothetical protein